MYTQSEERILKDLSRYKWSDRYCCYKCGHKEYMDGGNPLTRRCKKCKYEESLFKFTAFEGLRFSIEKAIGILDELVEKGYLDPEAKVIPWDGYRRRELAVDDIKGTEDHYNNGDCISMIDLIAIGRKRKWTEEKLTNKLENALRRYKPSIAGLAEDFELEENTVTKFFQKIENRIPIDNDYGSLSVMQYFNAHNRTLSGILSLLMFPLVGDWKSGITMVERQHYTIRSFAPLSDTCKIYSCKCTELYDDKYLIDENGREIPEYKYEINHNDEIVYASDRWIEIFCLKSGT